MKLYNHTSRSGVAYIFVAGRRWCSAPSKFWGVFKELKSKSRLPKENRMTAIFKPHTPILHAINLYADSFGPETSQEINKNIQYGLIQNSKKRWIAGRPDYVAGIIGELAGIGHGSDFISAK